MQTGPLPWQRPPLPAPPPGAPPIQLRGEVLRGHSLTWQLGVGGKEILLAIYGLAFLYMVPAVQQAAFQWAAPAAGVELEDRGDLLAGLDLLHYEGDLPSRWPRVPRFGAPLAMDPIDLILPWDQGARARSAAPQAAAGENGLGTALAAMARGWAQADRAAGLTRPDPRLARALAGGLSAGSSWRASRASPSPRLAAPSSKGLTGTLARVVSPTPLQPFPASEDGPLPADVVAGSGSSSSSARPSAGAAGQEDAAAGGPDAVTGGPRPTPTAGVPYDVRLAEYQGLIQNARSDVERLRRQLAEKTLMMQRARSPAELVRAAREAQAIALLAQQRRSLYQGRLDDMQARTPLPGVDYRRVSREILGR